MSEPPARFPIGSELTNAIMEGILQALPTVLVGGPGMEIRKAGRKVMFTPSQVAKRSGGPYFALSAYRVKKVYGDYLECHTFDIKAFNDAAGDPAGEAAAEGTGTVYVAIPYEMQQTAFDGVTIDYTGLSAGEVEYVYTTAKTTAGFVRQRAAETTDNGVVEQQVQVPQYYENAVIFAIAASSGTLDAAGDSVGLMDANVTGRMWARAET